MRSAYRFVSMPVLFAFITCILFSTYTPGLARAGVGRTLLGIFGAVTGAALMATLAASFGPIGIACAGMIGAGLGFAGGAAIGAIVGGHSGGFWGALGGIGTGGIIGAAVGALGAGILAANFGIVGICAGALIGAWGGGKLSGAFDDDVRSSSTTSAAKYLEPRSTTVKPDLSFLQERYQQSQLDLRKAVVTGNGAAKTQALRNYNAAQRDFFKARQEALGN